MAIRLQAFGDTVITLPYLSALRRRVPAAELDFLTREEVADLPRAIDLFDSVHAIGGGRSPMRQMVSAAAMLPRLLRRRYDLVLDLQKGRVSRFVRRALRPAAWTEFDRFSPKLAGERTRLTIEASGLGELEVRPDLSLRQRDVGVARLRRAGWKGTGDLVVLNPAGAFPGRSWPLASYARFAELWAAGSPTTTFIVLGLGNAAPKAAALAERLGERLIDLVGQTSAPEAFDILARARLVVSEDSGLMHLAWVAGASTLGLFGASRATWARPHGNYSDCLRACTAPDGKCLDGACEAGSPSCLARVDPTAVAERARQLLTRTEGAQRLLYSAGTAYAPPVD